MTDWPQVGGNAAHTGYSPDALGATAPAATWRHVFTPTERINPQVQAIVSGGRVYVGTMGLGANSSRLFALSTTIDNTASGWTGPVTVDAPILRSVACDGTRVYVVTQVGSVYAFAEATGALVWGPVSLGHPCTAAPVVADGQVLLVDLGGRITSLSPTTGAENWHYDVTITTAGHAFPCALAMTPAHDGTRLICPRMDGAITAVTTATQAFAWTSPVLPGMGFTDYYPVVVTGKVYVRCRWVFAVLGPGDVPNVTPTNRDVWTGTWLTDANRNSLLTDARTTTPGNYQHTLYRVDAATGAWTTADAIMHGLAGICMYGVNPPVCLDGDGMLVLPVVKSGIDAGVWGRLDISGGTNDGEATAQIDFASGTSQNHDETMAVSAAGRRVVILHAMDTPNTQAQGTYHLDLGTWTDYPTGTSSPQLTANMETGLTNAPSISGTWVYHLAFSQLLARNTA